MLDNERTYVSVFTYYNFKNKTLISHSIEECFIATRFESDIIIRNKHYDLIYIR
jgi:hypothetical protein